MRRFSSVADAREIGNWVSDHIPLRLCLDRIYVKVCIIFGPGVEKEIDLVT